jgi:carbamoyltransferase
MGLASYGDPKLVSEAPEFVKEIDGEISLLNNSIYPKVTWASDFFSRSVAAGIYQREQERASLILAKMAKNMTNSKNICVAGGSFLNCNSNELILKSGLYENCFFLPPADDSGIPLGCAWYALQKVTEIKNTSKISPYFGRPYHKNEIISALNEHPELDFIEYKDFNELVEQVTYWLTQNRVIGWFQDGSEIGPRALGNRSIVASPMTKWMCGHINADIKGREWYRPFAPAVLYEYQNEIFDMDYFSPHMLVTTTVKESWRERIPSVVHIDNSARIQSVTEKNNYKFYTLIKSFYEKTQVPVLLNTSFNGPSEPIVETPTDAIKTFITRNLNYLVLNNFLIWKN